ncbi:MAG: tetratricopeptide repeat protein [Woeseiaceae bacterium]
MTLWIFIAVLCLVATLFVAYPLYRHEKRLSSLIIGCVVLIVGVSLLVYDWKGSPNVPSAVGGGAAPDVAAMVESLATRLEEDADDIEGWKLLGRSYVTLQDFAGAVDAYEKAVALENSQQAQTLVDLGAAILARDNSRVEGRTAALFESALAIDPNNGEALFYGGIAAINRGDTELAIQRWEVVLSLSPPDNVRAFMEQRIAEWRGESPAAAPPTAEQAGPVVTLNIAVADAAANDLPAEASVFIVARDPAQPSPPIAVTRRQLSELPVQVTLGDRDAMIPGRNLSGFAEFEVIARISVSGEPIAQPGDWFAAAIVDPAKNDNIELVISELVP